MPSPNAIDVYVSAHPAANGIEKFKELTKPFALILPQGESALSRPFLTSRVKRRELTLIAFRAEDGQFDGVKDQALKTLNARRAAGIPFELYQHGSDTVHDELSLSSLSFSASILTSLPSQASPLARTSSFPACRQRSISRSSRRPTG